MFLENEDRSTDHGSAPWSPWTNVGVEAVMGEEHFEVAMGDDLIRDAHADDLYRIRQPIFLKQFENRRAT